MKLALDKNKSEAGPLRKCNESVPRGLFELDVAKLIAKMRNRERRACACECVRVLRELDETAIDFR